jgi:hypothetical protein
MSNEELCEYIYCGHTKCNSGEDPYDACQMRSCVDVTIVDDEILENVESFDLTWTAESHLTQ